MAAERSLSPELIRQLLDYDPETGAFTWLRRPERAGWDKTFNTRFAGKPALDLQLIWITDTTSGSDGALGAGSASQI